MILTCGERQFDLSQIECGPIAHPTDRQRIAEILKMLSADGESKFQSLPKTMNVDGQEIDIQYLRTWLAVGTGDSSSEISDLAVLRLIANGGIEGSFIPEMLRVLPIWPHLIDWVKRNLASGSAIAQATELQRRYRHRRGLMVLDVVASRQRRYESHVVPHYLNKYESEVEDLGLEALKSNSLNFLKLRQGEAETMKSLAAYLLSFDGEGDEKKVANFAKRSLDSSVRASAISINGIGEVLYEYLKILSGADSIKIDSRVRQSLGTLGIPESDFSDSGLFKICLEIARESNCRLVDLDQLLWNERPLST
jgi:hypothetical protein